MRTKDEQFDTGDGDVIDTYLDESLERLFAPPDVERLLQRVENGSDASPAAVFRLRRPVAIAAALLLVGVGLWRFGLVAPDDGMVFVPRASGFDVV